MSGKANRLLATLLAIAIPGTSLGVVVESWQFDDTAGTQLSGLTNDVGSAVFLGDKPQVATDGAGSLQFSVGSDESDNVFRNATLTEPNQSSGVFELGFSIVSADLSGGDASGANVGFGFRNGDTNTDLFIVRLHKQTDTLRLQTRISGANNDLIDLGVAALAAADTPLVVRAVADLDADLLDVYYTLGGGAEQSSLDIPIPDLEFDQVRLIANTNTADWGPGDLVKVDYLTLTADIPVPEPVVLDVDPTTGQVAIVNNTGADIDMAGYEIRSGSGSLNPAGWNSLQDQNQAGFPAGDGSGNGWEELGIAADYNGDGAVNLADYTMWRDHVGASVSPGSGADGNADGTIDQMDYELWKGRFGASRNDLLAEAYLIGSSVLADGAGPLTLGSAFDIGGTQDLEFRLLLADGSALVGAVNYVSPAAAGSATIPEPSACLLVTLGLAAVALGQRTRR